MPHISLTLFQGRSQVELERISRSIKTCLEETAGWKPGDISVSVKEVDPKQFALQVSERIQDEQILIPSELIS